MKARYRIRAKTDVELIDKGDARPSLHPDGSPITPYGLWDTAEHRWVDKWGQPDATYWACCRDVAVMRRRDLNGFSTPIQ